MSYFFVINPGANGKRGARFIQPLFRQLQRRGVDYDHRLTADLEEACLLSRQANEQGYDVVVAVGGDGTINKVINGFFDESGKRASKARLGVIHTGTSPDFCKSYGIPTQAELALETLFKGHSKPISVAKAEYHTASGTPRTGYFACCASIGLGAEVARSANSGIRKYLGDVPGTMTAILYSLSRYTASDLRLICDGRELLIPRNFNTFIGKTRYIASGLRVKNSLPVDADRLYVLSLKEINPANLITAIRAIYSGKTIQEKKYIAMSYAASIELSSPRANSELEYDGDAQGWLPCRISVALPRLELISSEL